MAEDIRWICPGGPQRMKRNGEEGDKQCADGSDEERPGPEWSAKNEGMEPLRHREMRAGPGDEVGDNDPFQKVDSEQ